MSSLKEKAKTAFEVWQHTVEMASKELPEHYNMRELSKKVDEIREQKDWVKFAEVQKEIDRLTEQRNIESGIVERMLKEKEELKQKLQEILQDCPFQEDFVPFESLDKNCHQCVSDMIVWKKKFEELVKVEREAKTT